MKLLICFVISLFLLAAYNFDGTIILIMMLIWFCPVVSLLSEMLITIDEDIQNSSLPDYIEEVKGDKNGEQVQVLRQLTGVHGWLKFLCITLTILGPFGLICMIVGVAVSFFQSNGYFPSIGEGLIFPLISLPMVIYGVIAGVRLWQISPGAVNFTKVYFIASVLYMILDIYISYYIYNGKTYYYIHRGYHFDGMVYFAFIIFIVKLVITMVWWNYLHKSERVHKTYSLKIRYKTAKSDQISEFES